MSAVDFRSAAKLFEKIKDESVDVTAGYLSMPLDSSVVAKSFVLKQSQPDLRDGTKKGSRVYLSSFVVVDETVGFDIVGMPSEVGADVVLLQPSPSGRLTAIIRNADSKTVSSNVNEYASIDFVIEM